MNSFTASSCKPYQADAVPLLYKVKLRNRGLVDDSRK